MIDGIPMSRPSGQSRARPWLGPLLALLVLPLASRIPLPGLDVATIARDPGGLEAFGPVISILALGLRPLLSGLALAELARLLLPRLVPWLEASPRRRAIGDRLAPLLVFAITLRSGADVLDVLQGAGLVEAGAQATITGLASFLGLSAVLVRLAQSERAGAGTGFWMLLAGATLWGLPDQAAILAETARAGWVSGAEALAASLYLMASTFALVGLWHALSEGSREPGPPSTALPVALLLWPPLLAETAWSQTLPALRPWLPEGWRTDPLALAWLQIAASAVLIPLFTFAYGRGGDARGAWRSPALLLGLVAGAGIAIAAGDQLFLLLGVSPPLLSGGELATLVVASLALGQALDLPGRIAARPGV